METTWAVPGQRGRYPTKNMTDFATTADIRSPDDSSIWSYVRLYLLMFAGMIGFDLVLCSLSLGFSDPAGPAAMAAFICTMPEQKPRFRSRSRFVIALFLAGVLSYAAAVSYRIAGVGEGAVTTWILNGIFYTVVFGCIESLSFWWTCVLTPGRTSGAQTADNHALDRSDA